ncbi:MAG: polysaccharide biosynthesis/export family protein [Bacteroidales bacterium]|nr:polysaccharide biosynthesis/export family protein [Bacteroidales bacterium]
MKLNIKTLRVPILALALAALASCATPANVAYFQDVSNDATLSHARLQPIRLKPADQISIVVSSRDPQVTAMFNLPYYSNRIGQSTSLNAMTDGAMSGSQGISGYTIDSEGYIDFPVLGPVLVADRTREQAAAHIKELLIASRQIKDPVVTVEFMNLSVAVLGEVARPGRFRIDRDGFTILDALSLAGDLTINGQRENVTLIRHEGAGEHTYTVNLTDAASLYSSPAYYLQQGDLIYVTPNDKRIRESTINGNNVRSTSFWFSAASLATSVILLILRIV